MKILLTATVQSHICQFHKPLINMLKEQGHEVHIAAKNNLDVKPGLKIENADKVFDVPFSRSPFSADNIKAYKILKKIIRENGYDIIHCNTPMGGVVTRLAADKKKSKLIYTVHGFHFFKGASAKNWLMYFPVEWILSFKTDTLICINEEDYNFAKKRLHAKKTEYVHGVGVDKNRFDNSLTKEQAKEKLGISEGEIVLLSVGDLNERKNHKVIINSLSLMQEKNVHLYIAGWDQLDGKLASLASELGVSDKVTFLGYTRQLSVYFSAADIFMFPSLQEGLPVALMEAMAMGVPVICSSIRGNTDLIKDGEGGYLCKPTDSAGFAEKADFLIKNENIRNSMSDENKKNIGKFFIESVQEEMDDIYQEILR